MTGKQIEYHKVESGHQMRQKLISGVQFMAKVVGDTLGPGGRTVMIDQSQNDPLVTKDGVTVAQNMLLGNPISGMAARITKQVANNANKEVGDGTTTATVLLEYMLDQISGKIKPVHQISDIRQGMNQALGIIKDKLDKKTISIHGDKMPWYVEKIAGISSDNDPEITANVKEIFSKLGMKGAIKVDLGRKHFSEIKLTEGITYAGGLFNLNFTTNAKQTEARLNNPYLLLLEHDIHSLVPIQNALELARKEGRGIIILANEYSEVAIQGLLHGKSHYNLKLAVIKAPGFGSQRSQNLEDIAFATGGVAFIKGSGIDYEDIIEHDPSIYLGEAESVVITMEDFTIMGGKGAKEKLDARVEMIKEKMEEEEDGYLKEQLAARMARLTDGLGVIMVGAHTEYDAKEKKDRYVDAVKAVKSAGEHGVVPGGGLTLWKIQKEIMYDLNGQHSDLGSNWNEEWELGFLAVVNSLTGPLVRILKNAEINPGNILKKLEKNADFDYGYNVRTRSYENFVNSGVLDPAKVPYTSVANAVSIVSNLISTEHAIYATLGEEVDYAEVVDKLYLSSNGNT